MGTRFRCEASHASSMPPTSLSSYSHASCISQRLILTQPLARGPRRVLPPRSSIHACAHAFIHAGLSSFSRLTSGAAQAWTDRRKKASLSEQMKAPLNRQSPTSPQQEAHTLKRQSPTSLRWARMWAQRRGRILALWTVEFPPSPQPLILASVMKVTRVSSTA